MARLSRSLTAVTHRASARSGRSPTAEVTFSKTRLGPPGTKAPDRPVDRMELRQIIETDHSPWHHHAMWRLVQAYGGVESFSMFGLVAIGWCSRRSGGAQRIGVERSGVRP